MCLSIFFREKVKKKEEREPFTYCWGAPLMEEVGIEWMGAVIGGRKWARNWSLSRPTSPSSFSNERTSCKNCAAPDAKTTSKIKKKYLLRHIESKLLTHVKRQNTHGSLVIYSERNDRERKSRGNKRTSLGLHTLLFPTEELIMLLQPSSTFEF